MRNVKKIIKKLKIKMNLMILNLKKKIKKIKKIKKYSSDEGENELKKKKI